MEAYNDLLKEYSRVYNNYMMATGALQEIIRMCSENREVRLAHNIADIVKKVTDSYIKPTLGV